MFAESKPFGIVLKRGSTTHSISTISASSVQVQQGGTKISPVNTKYAIDSANGDVVVTGGANASGSSYVVYVDGKTAAAGAFGYNSAIVFRIPISRFFPVTVSGATAPVTQKPRYVVKSPVINGAFTESVRELTAKQAGDLQNRGYMVEGTLRALSPAIKVLGNPQITTYDAVRRVPRKGIVDSFSAWDRRSSLRGIMGTRDVEIRAWQQPRRIFAEDITVTRKSGSSVTIRNVSAATKNYYQRSANFKVKTINNARTRPGGVTGVSRTDSTGRDTSGPRGGVLVVPNRSTGYTTRTTYTRSGQTAGTNRYKTGTVYLPKVPSSNRSTPTPSNDKRYSYTITYPTGVVVRRTSVSHGLYASERMGIGTIGNVQAGSTTSGAIGAANVWNASHDPKSDQRIQSLTVELKNLKAWLSEVNGRLSSQVVDLGQSTTDRDRQIQQLADWSATEQQRVSGQLVNLGQCS